jgi:hypothetical protein
MSTLRKQEGSAGEELYDRIWKTKSARFNAYHRFKKKHVLSTYTTSLLSAYVVILALLEPFDMIIKETVIEAVNFMSICVSILLLVIVVIENSMEYNLKAEKFHNCAKSMSKLFKKIEIANEISDENIKAKKIKSITKKYDDIINIYDNHDDIDYDFHLAKNQLKKLKKADTKNEADLKKVNSRINSLKNKQYKNNGLYYFGIWVVPILIIIIIIFQTIWS